MFFTHLLLGRNLVRVTRRATATIGGETPRAMISIGSRLARLDDGVANQLIGGLTGSKVSLSAMDYRRLIDLDINLLEFTDALSTLGTQSKSVSRQVTFLNKLQDATEAGIGNLVDADLAKESAKLTALQTKQQLGVQALSIANSSSQSLLSLFR